MSVRAISSSKTAPVWAFFSPSAIDGPNPGSLSLFGEKAYFTPHPMGMNSRVYSLTEKGSVIPAI